MWKWFKHIHNFTFVRVMLKVKQAPHDPNVLGIPRNVHEQILCHTWIALDNSYNVCLEEKFKCHITRLAPYQARPITCYLDIRYTLQEKSMIYHKQNACNIPNTPEVTWLLWYKTSWKVHLWLCHTAYHNVHYAQTCDWLWHHRNKPVFASHWLAPANYHGAVVAIAVSGIL